MKDLLATLNAHRQFQGMKPTAVLEGIENRPQRNNREDPVEEDGGSRTAARASWKSLKLDSKKVRAKFRKAGLPFSASERTATALIEYETAQAKQ